MIPFFFLFFFTEEEERKGNVLFNDALNTFYLRLYGKEGVIWKGRKEMFYLTTHSTHFIYGYMERKEGNVLFNDALNTFYLRLYGVRHMVKDHSDSEKGNPLLPHRLLFPINSKGFFYMHHPTDRIEHTTAFVTPVMEHWLKKKDQVLVYSLIYI